MTVPVQVKTAGRTERQKGVSARRFPLLQLVFDVILPLGSYYGLRALGLSQWWCLALGTVLGLPWIVHGIVKRRKVDVMGLFTLSIMAVATLLSLVTGDPRTLLVRDSWLTAVIGLWVLGTVPTRHPFMLAAMRNVFLAKGGEEAAAGWDSRWDASPAFRRKIRFLTGVWGTVFTLDAGVRVACAATLPVDTVPTVNTVQWLVVLAGLMVFHKHYITRKGLKA
ncbi:VC0807 family protein [Streptomyces klenkii]